MHFGKLLQDGKTEMEERALYLRAFVNSHKEICAISPTCWRVIHHLRDKIQGKARNIIELGSGSGRLVRDILEADLLAQDGKILSLEPNEEFAGFQRSHILDPRVDIVEGRAEDLHEFAEHSFGHGEKADYVFASLPFSVMENRLEIYEQIRSVSKPGTEFITYIFRDISESLRQVFPNVEVEKVRGQWVPPWRYLVQSAHVGDEAPVYRNGHAHPAAEALTKSARRWQR